MRFFYGILFFSFFFIHSFCSSKQLAALPRPEGASVQKPLIYLDPGHGGLDEGAVIRSPYCVEKKLCLSTAHLVKRYLEQKGYKVSLTRYRDFFVPLPKRVELANKAKAGLYISLHFNSCPNPSAKGIEIFYTEEKNNRSLFSKKLAANILQAMVEKSKAVSRGVKKGNLYVTKQTKMPSVLIEVGFLTNPEERSLIRQKQYLDKIAKGIVEGIDKFVQK